MTVASRYQVPVTLQVRHGFSDERGAARVRYEDAGEFRAFVSSVKPMERLRWEQMQHPVTDVLAIEGPQVAKTGDRFVMDGRNLYVQGIQNPGHLNLWVLYHCEEREDA